MYVTVEDVRSYVLDRSIQDDVLGLDLAFSDDEIIDAMRRCAREYNSIPPFVTTWNENKLPGDTNIALDGIVLHLYLARLAKLQRQDFDYQAGGIQVNDVAKEIGHLGSAIKLYGERFRSAAQTRKLVINLEGAYGIVG